MLVPGLNNEPVGLLTVNDTTPARRPGADRLGRRRDRRRQYRERRRHRWTDPLHLAVRATPGHGRLRGHHHRDRPGRRARHRPDFHRDAGPRRARDPRQGRLPGRARRAGDGVLRGDGSPVTANVPDLTLTGNANSQHAHRRGRKRYDQRPWQETIR
ncbi:MAG: hypothetical protein M0C28_31925 [Candidatus Moduliflexus flocculans]|nr:hypothetical protein [Candidatus Moduliflexus flocculans]